MSSVIFQWSRHSFKESKSTNMFSPRLFLVVISILLNIQNSSSITITNHLKIALVESDPFCMKDSNGKAKGFLVDLVKELLHRVNTSGTQSVTYETHWVTLGNESSEGDMWDIVRQQLLSGEADMALVPLVDTIGWNGVIQMSQPYLLTPFLALGSRRVLGTQANGQSSIMDQIRKGQIKPIYVIGSAMAGLIDNDNRTPIKNLGFQVNDSQVSTYPEGVSRVNNQPDRFVLFGEELRLRQFLLRANNCDLALDWESVVGIGGYTLPISLYVQSQPLVSSINMNLLRMRQDGTIAVMVNNWWKVSADATCQSDERRHQILGSLEKYF